MALLAHWIISNTQGITNEQFTRVPTFSISTTPTLLSKERCLDIADLCKSNWEANSQTHQGRSCNASTTASRIGFPNIRNSRAMWSNCFSSFSFIWSMLQKVETLSMEPLDVPLNNGNNRRSIVECKQTVEASNWESNRYQSYHGYRRHNTARSGHWWPGEKRRKDPLKGSDYGLSREKVTIPSRDNKPTRQRSEPWW